MVFVCVHVSVFVNGLCVCAFVCVCVCVCVNKKHFSFQSGEHRDLSEKQETSTNGGRILCVSVCIISVLV